MTTIKQLEKRIEELERIYVFSSENKTEVSEETAHAFLPFFVKIELEKFIKNLDTLLQGNEVMQQHFRVNDMEVFEEILRQLDKYMVQHGTD